MDPSFVRVTEEEQAFSLVIPTEHLLLIESRCDEESHPCIINRKYFLYLVKNHPIVPMGLWIFHFVVSTYLPAAPLGLVNCMSIESDYSDETLPSSG